MKYAWAIVGNECVRITDHDLPAVYDMGIGYMIRYGEPVPEFMQQYKIADVIPRVEAITADHSIFLKLDGFHDALFCACNFAPLQKLEADETAKAVNRKSVTEPVS